MACERCGSLKSLTVSAKCSDLCNLFYEDGIRQKEKNGYVPANINIGEGDYIEFELCVECGRIRGNFPIPTSMIDKAMGE